MTEIYVVVNVDSEGNVIGFPKGGGSSTKGTVRAFETYSAAQRSIRFLNFKEGEITVKQVTGFGDVL